MGCPVDKIVDLLLDKGVPPLLLASNIKEDNYSEVRLVKEQGKIVVYMSCTDLEYPDVSLNYQYTYSQSGYLLRIERLLDNGRETEWDRASELLKMIKAIEKHEVNVRCQVTQLIQEHVPKDVQEHLSSLVA